MSSRSLRRPKGRALGAAALSAALGVAGLGLAAPPAGATPDFALERLAGDDRIETAVEISSATFESSSNALLARADLYPDALAGNYLAGAAGAPILLSHTDEVPQETLDELERLGVETVWLLGGTNALSDAVQDALEDAGFAIERVAGTDRYKTAAEVATSQDATTIGDTDDGRTALLATGENFADALTGGPLAYAGSHPLLLTPGESLSEDAAGALEELEIDHVAILGGTAAVDASVEDALNDMGLTTQRLAGQTRFDTATEIANFALAQGFSDEHVDVATGLKFPDALTGGPHAGENAAPILLANENNTTEACDFLTAQSDTVAEGHIFGGTAAVSTAVEGTLEACGRGEGPMATDFPIDITPQEPDVNFVTEPHTYTVAADDAEATPNVDLIAIPRQAVNINEETGAVHLEDDDGDGFADFVDAVQPGSNISGARITSINSVNPVGGSTPYVNNQTLASGPVTVTLNSTVPDEVYLLAFHDANNDNRLAVDGDFLPTEPIGLSGYKAWTGPEAEFSAGAGDGTAIFQVMIGGNVIVGSRFIDHFDLFAVDSASVNGVQTPGARMEYDDGDEFRIDGALVTKAEFEQALSPGDLVLANYNPNGMSEFDIVVDVGYNAPQPGAFVTNLDGSGGENDVALSVPTPPDNQVFAEYAIQRASSAGPDGICNTGDDFTPGTVPNSAFETIQTVMLDRLAGEDPGDTINTADLNPGDGCYLYRTQVVDPNTAEVRNSAVTGPVTVPAPPDTAAPNAINVVFIDPANPNQLGPGDVIDIIFDEQVLAEAGDEIQIEDIDGEFDNLILGTGNEFEVITRGGVGRNAQTQLRIEITEPIVIDGDTDADNTNNDGILDFTGVDLLGINGADGIEDLGGNDWEPAMLAIFEDNNGPMIADDLTIEGASTFTIWFNEPVDPASAGDPSNYLVNNAGDFTPGNGGANPVVSVVMSNDGYQPNPPVVAPFINGWTQVQISTQFPVGEDTVVSQTVSDKLGNSGDFDTQAVGDEYPLTAGGIVTLSPQGDTTESGSTADLDVTLARQVTQPVDVTLASQDPDECTVSPTMLTFGVGPAGQTQTVTVTGVDDDIADGDQDCEITATASSSDPQYEGATDSALVTNLDDDTAGFVVTGTPVEIYESAAEGPTSQVIGVALASEPTGTVNVTVTANSIDGADNAPDFTASPTTLTFTPGNWDVPQGVTLDSVDDPSCGGSSEATSLTLEGLPGSDYDGVSSTVPVDVLDPEDVCGGPFVVDSHLVPGSTDALITYSEDVDCRVGNPAVADNFFYDQQAPNGFGDRTGQSVSQPAANQCQVDFGGGNWTSEDAGNVTYTRDSGASCGTYPPASGCPSDVVDLDNSVGDSAVAAINETFEISLLGTPDIAFMSSSEASDTVFVVFDEPVVCSSLDFTDFEVRVNGSLVPVVGLSIDCSAPTDNDIGMTVGFDIQLGDDVEVTIQPDQVFDWQGNGNVLTSDNVAAT
jgi:putative cell wall-binding protein